MLIITIVKGFHFIKVEACFMKLKFMVPYYPTTDVMLLRGKTPPGKSHYIMSMYFTLGNKIVKSFVFKTVPICWASKFDSKENLLVLFAVKV